MLAFVRWLFSEGYIDRDITERVKKPRPPQDQKAPFTPRDLHALLATAKQTTRGARDHALLCVMVDCGLRASEVCQLSVDDVMVPDRLVRVRQGKGRKDRIVPCSAETAKVVYRYLTRVRRQIDTDVPNLFLNARQKQMTANGLLQLVMRLGEAAQVENVHPHRFRHTFALSYLQNGGDPLTLQRLMGHTTLTMTNHYVSMATDDLQRVHQTASPLMNLLK
jgi:integrase/recombinase XerD